MFILIYYSTRYLLFNYLAHNKQIWWISNTGNSNIQKSHARNINAANTRWLLLLGFISPTAKANRSRNCSHSNGMSDEIIVMRCIKTPSLLFPFGMVASITFFNKFFTARRVPLQTRSSTLPPPILPLFENCEIASWL